MNEVVVSDTGSLLHLAEIGQERQLNLFRLIIISDEVKNELLHHNVFHNVKSNLESRLVIKEVARSALETCRNSLSEFRLHQTDLSVFFWQSNLGLIW